MKLAFPTLCLFVIAFACFSASAQPGITVNAGSKVVKMTNKNLQLTVDYNRKCVITEMKVNGESVISSDPGVFSGFRTTTGNYSTQGLASSPVLNTSNNKVIISGIRYGDPAAPIDEVWTFNLTNQDIKFDIRRKVSKSLTAEEVAFPSFNFKNIRTWDGAFLEFGGLAWFYLFNEKLCTYGVHSGSSVFWNSTTGNGLSVSVKSPGKQVAAKFTRTENDQLTYNITLSDDYMQYRYDSGTQRRRFIRGKTDVWHPFEIPAGLYEQSISLSHTSYKSAYDRGKFAGINGNNVTNLLNTIARMGVIDAKLFGGNSWHTPYGPICLHEQYIAQMGIGINDPAYLEGYKHCLENYRDHAIEADGRVISRWAYSDEDAMPGKATPLGFYEAQWGYLMDSNPDFVTNVSELYQQNGDLNWVKTFKAYCEKALEYMLKRDSNRNHLVEMMTDSHTQKRGSDWIDIIWASYENAFVNVKLYYALKLWADIEAQLGDHAKSKYYATYASELKKSFNRSTTLGGFWDEQNKWYVHWLDKDGSVHGNNLVTPVNFMAIAYGICDDESRKKAILDRVEMQMQKENLFAWPLCMYTYAPGEGNDWQFPFPNYENGDIFLSWGAVGVEAYAAYDPDLALKYIENILSRYEKDGLAFQRYGRLKQDGLGDDILSGNSLALIGLYKSIYGINPQHDRLQLAPHLPAKLLGTELNYKFRGEKLNIGLDRDRYSISNGRFKIIASSEFGYNVRGSQLEYFHSNTDSASLKAVMTDPGKLTLEIIKWEDGLYKWKQTGADKTRITYQVNGLRPGLNYEIISVDRPTKTIKSGAAGSLTCESVGSGEWMVRLKK